MCIFFFLSFFLEGGGVVVERIWCWLVYPSRSVFPYFCIRFFLFLFILYWAAFYFVLMDHSVNSAQNMILRRIWGKPQRKATEAATIEELQILTALHFKEAPTDETGRRIGRHMEIQIFDGETNWKRHIIEVTGSWQLIYSWPKFHKGSMEMAGTDLAR